MTPRLLWNGTERIRLGSCVGACGGPDPVESARIRRKPALISRTVVRSLPRISDVTTPSTPSRRIPPRRRRVSVVLPEDVAEQLVEALRGRYEPWALRARARLASALREAQRARRDEQDEGPRAARRSVS